MRDDDIAVAVAVEIRRGEKGLGFQRYFFERGLRGRVLELVRTDVAKQLDLRLAIRVEARGDKVDKAIVVVIEGNDAGRALPARRRQRHLLVFAAVHVAQQDEAGGDRSSESEIHPPVFIEVE